MTSGKNKLIKRVEEYYMYMVIPIRKQTSDGTFPGSAFIIPVMLQSRIHQQKCIEGEGKRSIVSGTLA